MTSSRPPSTPTTSSTEHGSSSYAGLPTRVTARRCAGRNLDNLTFNFKGATRRSAPFRFTSPCHKCDPLAGATKTIGVAALVTGVRSCLTGRLRASPNDYLGMSVDNLPVFRPPVWASKWEIIHARWIGVRKSTLIRLAQGSSCFRCGATCESGLLCQILITSLRSKLLLELKWPT